VDDLTHAVSKRRESIGLGVGNILAGFTAGLGCAMIGQTIVNVEMGKGRSRISTFAAGIVLLILVTALSDVMAKSRWRCWRVLWRLSPSKPSAGTAFSQPR
jgi:SulP family sulfate permease